MEWKNALAWGGAKRWVGVVRSQPYSSCCCSRCKEVAAKRCSHALRTLFVRSRHAAAAAVFACLLEVTESSEATPTLSAVKQGCSSVRKCASCPLLSADEKVLFHTQCTGVITCPHALCLFPTFACEHTKQQTECYQNDSLVHTCTVLVLFLIVFSSFSSAIDDGGAALYRARGQPHQRPYFRTH